MTPQPRRNTVYPLSRKVYTHFVMPRGNPKRKVMLRLDAVMVERVRLASDGNFTRVIEHAITEWLKRAERKAKADQLAKYLAPATEREFRVRKGGE